MGPLEMFGARLRGLIDSVGTKLKLIIRRLYCPKCDRIHHELPDCIVPYKRHCAGTIEKIISGTKETGPVTDDRTVQRIIAWWKVMLPYFSGILNGLTQKHGVQFGNPPAFKEIIRAVVGANHWNFKHSVSTCSSAVSSRRVC
jgi:hypothetical protein